MDTTAEAVIERLGLAPHPEGGWYRETWRDTPAEGGRGRGTAILFLLSAGERSRWHRVTDAAELWLHHAGGPVVLRVADGAAPAEHRLGTDILAGDTPQTLVPDGAWQDAHAPQGWALVSCVVVPAFSFNSFELAPPGWAWSG